MTKKIDVRITPQEESTVKKYLDAKQPAIDEVVRACENITIDNAEDAQYVSGLLSRVSGEARDLEEMRKRFVKPFNDAVRNLNAEFKKRSEPLAVAKQILSGKMVRYQEQEQARINAEREKIRKEEERRRKIQESHAAKGHEVSEPVSLDRPDDVENKIGSIHFRSVRKWKVTDIHKVPEQFLTVDTVAVNKAVNAQVEIPGIYVWIEKTTVS